MVVRPGSFRAFGNDHQMPQKGGSFIEGTVELGQAQGTGQYRVVCELDTDGKVVRKYWSASHYGTGSDASKKPAFVGFQ